MNPFYRGNPVSPPHFQGRKKELRRATQRIRSSQSIAFVGEPRTGKTSLLLYLKAPENQMRLYAEDIGQQRIFSFLDALTFDSQINSTQFWVFALAPILNLIQKDPELASLYQNCLDKDFNHHSLTLLLDRSTHQNIHLVVMLDEFDNILNLASLCKSEFLGSLRSLASLNPALSLIIASRLSISSLNNRTENLNNTGSPYFNIFEEYTLSSFSDQEVELLLSKAGDRFNQEDIDFISHAAGAHPYLLQAIAAELWDIYEDGEIDDPIKRRQQAAKALYDVAARTLEFTWRAWPPHMRMAFTVVSLSQTPELLEERSFNNEVLLRDLRNFGPELRDLEKQGYVKKHEDESAWRILPAAFQWWLADELVRVVRAEHNFEHWLQAQEWDGMLTKNEKEQFKSALKNLAASVKDKGSVLNQLVQMCTV